MEENFQSQTMCMIDIPNDFEPVVYADGPPDEEILMYENSQGHNHVAIVTNSQSIYVYSLAEMRTKFYEKQQRMEK